jgi:phosphatidylserine decarboxylase precursor-related protein
MISNILYHEYFYILLIILVVLLYKKSNIKYLLIVIIIFLILFHYSPDKIKEYNKNIYYSPANGEIIKVERLSNRLRISIYLRIYNNHTQYLPIDSYKIKEMYEYGSNNFAYDIDKSEHNQRMVYTFRSDKIGYYNIILYSGFFTRRIFSLVNMNNENKLLAGSKISYITLGSRVDIIVPYNDRVKILKKVGEKVNSMEELLDYRDYNKIKN